MRVRKRITIELKSDLCIASGYSYAGLIDSDICYDEFGIPYIPGKRYKGCLRQTAEKELHTLTDGHVEEIFGNSRDDGTKGIIIENAYPLDYEALTGALRKIQNSSNRRLKEHLSVQHVLGEYTTIKAQTRLNSDGVADDKTLRYTRTVNRYTAEKQELVFETYVTYESTDITEKILPLVVSATKHIGLNRNRGLGNIKCSLSKEPISEPQNLKSIQDPESVEASGDDIWELEYIIKNTEPLMLSNMTDDTSETLVRGQSVLGLLASQYLSRISNQIDSQEFCDLFLNGKACFSDLVISRNGIPYYPAPLFVRKLKKSGKYVNIEYEYNKNDFEGQEIEDYNPESGNLPKKISDKFVHFNPGNIMDVAEVDRKLVFHHSHKGSNRYGGEAILYANEVVSENQEFMGSIFLPGKYAKTMMRLLINADIRFGKSKTAQYGKCVLSSLKAEKKAASSNLILNQGEIVAVVFLSDTCILFNNQKDRVHYTVFEDEVITQVSEELKKRGISCSRIPTDGTCCNEAEIAKPHLNYEVFLETSDISGYNTKINMRKPTMQAIKAGSVICYQLTESAASIEGYIGEKSHEGYGHFIIMPIGKMTYKMDAHDKGEAQETLSSDDLLPVRNLAKRIIKDELKDEIRLKAISDVEDIHSKLRLLNASNVGRVTLMLRESINQYPGNVSSAFESFYSRIESIKKTEELKAVRKALLSQIADPQEKEDDSGETITVWNLSSKKIRALLKESDEDVELFDWVANKSMHKDDDDELKVLWSEYIMTALVYRKYQLAER